LLQGRQGEREEALRHLERAARLEPNNTDYAYVLAEAWHDSGRFREAIELLRRQLQAQPDNRRVRMTLASYLGVQGSTVEVERLREVLRTINPEDPSLK
jgi:cytochrome c-type biogenesis protein CcmH/NrfG